ncbi:hypothetical protein [Tenacibaculum amylolyticum]|uniref:hypothetical protein n=1 Tax=Tenacibaculum amylolyticum TaxID=104269 RepID=UPI0038963D88
MIYFLILIIVLTIGNTFYNLAKKYRKSKLGYSLLGVFSFVLGMSLYLLLYWLLIDYLHFINRYIHEFVSFLIGVLLAITIHYFLEKKWKKHKNIEAEASIKKIGKE